MPSRGAQDDRDGEGEYDGDSVGVAEQEAEPENVPDCVDVPDAVVLVVRVTDDERDGVTVPAPNDQQQQHHHQQQHH